MLAHVDTALIFAEPPGCAASHALTHAPVVQPSAQSMSAMQSASPRHVFATPQQLVSRHESHVASPLAKPHALTDGPPEGPPHAAEQLVSTHEESESSSRAPLGCAEKQAPKQASSVHALPHAISAVQSASATHAAFGAQQLASRHASHVASPVERPQLPAPFVFVEPSFGADFLPDAFVASAAIAVVLSTLFESARLVRNVTVASAPSGSARPDVFRISVVVVHAKVNVDAMAIAPKVVAFIVSSEGRISARLARASFFVATVYDLARRASLLVRT